MKLVINVCYGGFGLSDKAFICYLNKKGIKFTREKSEWSSLGDNFYNENGEFLSDYNLDRSDSVLIGIVEELGSKEASGMGAELKIIEIPDGIEYEIEEYDGVEWVAEKHRTWN
jgi:hypothetical protein